MSWVLNGINYGLLLLSARLQLERARIASETLALIGLPALVFDNLDKVLAANHLMAALTDQIIWRAQNRFSLKDTSADALFQPAIAALDAEGATSVLSFASRGVDAAMVAHVVPIRGISRDIFARSAGVLVITPVTIPQAPWVEAPDIVQQTATKEVGSAVREHASGSLAAAG